MTMHSTSLTDTASGNRTVAFELRGVTPTLNEIRHMDMHTYRRLREGLAWQVRAALNGVGYFAQPPMLRAAVAIARYSMGSPDHDGVTGGMKPLLDCLVMPSVSHPNGLGVILDDRPACLVLVVASGRAASHADQRMVVAIRELESLPVAEKPARKRYRGPARPSQAAVTRGNRFNAKRLGLG